MTKKNAAGALAATVKQKFVFFVEAPWLPSSRSGWTQNAPPAPERPSSGCNLCRADVWGEKKASSSQEKKTHCWKCPRKMKDACQPSCITHDTCTESPRPTWWRLLHKYLKRVTLPQSTKKATCTVRTLSNIPTCLHHWVMSAHVSHSQPSPCCCSPYLVGDTTNAVTFLKNAQVHIFPMLCKKYWQPSRAHMPHVVQKREVRRASPSTCLRGFRHLEMRASVQHCQTLEQNSAQKDSTSACRLRHRRMPPMSLGEGEGGRGGGTEEGLFLSLLPNSNPQKKEKKRSKHEKKKGKMKK